MIREKLSDEKIGDRIEKDLRHNIYPHGGSRIFIDGEAGDRVLLIDTYHTKEFAEYIKECTIKYFES